MRETCLEWLKTFLKERDGLTRPDGRALFRYRVTEKECNELEQLLRQWLSAFPSDDNLAELSDDLLFCKLFVLYGAEWWRRRYDGSGFCWEPILHAVQADPAAWTPQQRARCVRNGFDGWGVQIRQHGGKRYILSVALQGGLPLRLLAEGRGGLGRLLKRVLQLAAGTSINRQDIEGWVESLQAMLPTSYRQPAIYLLLTDIVLTVLQLKEEADLTSSMNAVDRLNEQLPGWRNRFPLPLEDTHAEGLLAQLLRDAVEIRLEATTISFALERCLEKIGDDWGLYSTLSLPPIVQEQEMTAFFNIQTGDLPRVAELTLRAGREPRTVNLQRMAGHSAYRLERKPLEWHDEEAGKNHTLELSLADGRNWFGEPRRGGELDDELPWIFSAENRFSFLKQGSGKIAETEALLVLPTQWAVHAEDGGECQEQGFLPLFYRKIWRIRGVILAADGHDGSCRFKTGQADAEEIDYYWQGKQLRLDFLSPAKAFLGCPLLHTLKQDGTHRAVQGNPQFITPDSGRSSQLLGPVIAKFPARGEVRYRSRLVVLPEKASIELKCLDANSGAILLKYWGASNARLRTAEVQMTTRKNDHALELFFTLDPGQRSPEQVEVEILWPHTTVPARMLLPYPAKGARAFTIEGQELQNGARISTQQLLGARIILYTARHNVHTEIVLRSSLDRTIHSFPIHRETDSLQQTLRLQNYIEDIQHLLTADDGLDSMVQLKVILEGEEIFHLRIARYFGHLKKVDDRVALNDSALAALDSQTLKSLRIQAVNLTGNSDEVLELPQVTDEEGSCGSWSFIPEEREPGPWLLYPAPDSPFSLRPLLWFVEGTVETETKLTGAMEYADPTQRHKALAETITELTADFCHPGWQEVEQLADGLGHLPLTSLDLWRSFAYSPTGMTALLLRFGSLPRNFVSRFEQELPFSWEVIPYVVWKQAMMTLQRQCATTFGDQAGQTVFLAHLRDVIEKITDDHPALQYILGIVKANFDADAQQEVKGLQFVGIQAESRLFAGDDSPLQRLRRNHASDSEHWPVGCSDHLRLARSDDALSKYLCPAKYGFHDPVINLPLMLAIQCGVAGQTEEWLRSSSRISLLRTCRTFDHDWFAEAYNLTIARCLADGLLS